MATKTKKAAAKKAAKTATSRTGQFREGSFLANLHALLSDGNPHAADEIVKGHDVTLVRAR